MRAARNDTPAGPGRYHNETITEQAVKLADELQAAGYDDRNLQYAGTAHRTAAEHVAGVNPASEAVWRLTATVLRNRREDRFTWTDGDIQVLRPPANVDHHAWDHTPCRWCGGHGR